MARGSTFSYYLFLALRVLGSAAFVALVAVLVVNGLGARKPRREPKTGLTATKVETTRAAPHVGEFEFDVDGVVIPYREVRVAAEAAGRVAYKSLACRGGAPVKEGDLLFRIDPRDADLEIQRLRFELEQAEGSLDELQVQLEASHEQQQLAEEDLVIRQGELKRYLDSPDTSVFSRTEIDQARRNELAARNSLQAIKDERRLLVARQRRTEGAKQLVNTQLERATLDRQRCDVEAPISGMIVSEDVQQEGYVQKGGVLLSIRDTSVMEVRCSLRLSQLQWLRQAARQTDAPAGDVSPGFPAAAAEVTLQIDGQSYHWPGRLVRYLDSGVDQRTRLVPCIVEVTEPSSGFARESAGQVTGRAPRLLAGMYVQVRIKAPQVVPLLRLPVEAVGPGGQIWTVRKSALHRVLARVVHADPTRVLVEQSAELPAGAEIVVSPLPNPFEGGPVEVIQAGGLAATGAKSDEATGGAAPPGDEAAAVAAAGAGRP